MSPPAEINDTVRMCQLGTLAVLGSELAINDVAVFHFVDPIARFGNRRIVRGESTPCRVYARDSVRAQTRARS